MWSQAARSGVTADAWQAAAATSVKHTKEKTASLDARLLIDTLPSNTLELPTLASRKYSQF